MDECPQCKKWTLNYYPQNETQICSNCGFQRHVKYDDFIRQKNVINRLLYPSQKWTLALSKRPKSPFHFYLSLNQYTGESAISLEEFSEKIGKIEAKSLEFHFYRKDFQSWIIYSIGDTELAEKMNNLYQQNPSGEILRNQLQNLISKRFAKTGLKPITTH